MGLLTYAAVASALMVSQPVSDNFWGTNKCSETKTVQILNYQQLSTTRRLENRSSQQTAIADSDPLNCTMRFAWDVFNYKSEVCTARLHEEGHLSGITFDNSADPFHSLDPTNIMYSEFNRLYVGCVKAFPPRFVSWQNERKKSIRWKCKVVSVAHTFVWHCKKTGYQIKTFYAQ